MPSKLAFKLIFKYRSKGRWRFIVQRNLAVLWPMKMCTFPVEITKRRAQSLRMKMWNAELRIWKELQLFTACSRMQQDYPNYIRGRKSMEYLCNLMNYLCFTTEVWKKHCFPFKNALLFLLPTQYNVENQKKLKVVVFNIVWGVGARLGRWVSIRTWCERKRTESTNLSQDFCPWLSEFHLRNKMSLFSAFSHSKCVFFLDSLNRS